MNFFIFFGLLVAHSVAFAGEIVLSVPFNQLPDPGHLLSNLTMESCIENTKTYDDVKKNKFLILTLRKVCSNFNQLIENSESIRNAISSGKMKNLLPYFFNGLPEEPKYNNRQNTTQRYIFFSILALPTTHCISYLQLSPKIEYPVLFITGSFINIPIQFEFFDPIISRTFAPYFYLQWKKEQKKYNVLEHNLNFVTDKKNVLLSKSFEDLIVENYFDADKPWYEYVLFNPRNLKTIYGEMIHINRIDEDISYPNWPAILEMSIIQKKYVPTKQKQLQLIDFSDEFEEISRTPYKYELPFDCIIYIKIKPKENDNNAWNYSLNSVDINEWFEGFKTEFKKDKKIKLLYNVPERYFKNQEFWKNLELISEMFFERFNVTNKADIESYLKDNIQ